MGATARCRMRRCLAWSFWRGHEESPGDGADTPHHRKGYRRGVSRDLSGAAPHTGTVPWARARTVLSFHGVAGPALERADRRVRRAGLDLAPRRLSTGGRSHGAAGSQWADRGRPGTPGAVFQASSPYRVMAHPAVPVCATVSLTAPSSVATARRQSPPSPSSSALWGPAAQCPRGEVDAERGRDLDLEPPRLHAQRPLPSSTPRRTSAPERSTSRVAVSRTSRCRLAC